VGAGGEVGVGGGAGLRRDGARGGGEVRRCFPHKTHTSHLNDPRPPKNPLTCATPSSQPLMTCPYPPPPSSPRHPLASHFNDPPPPHLRDPLVPALDDLPHAQLEGEGRPAVTARVKLLAVGLQGADVVDGDLAVGRLAVGRLAVGRLTVE
jgi:hypothetical protein